MKFSSSLSTAPSAAAAVVAVAILTLVTILPVQVSSERILAVFLFGTKSHKIAFDPLLDELANRGHQLTVFTQFKSPKTVGNLSEIIAPGYEEILADKGGMPNAIDMRIKGEQMNPMTMIHLIEHSCEANYATPQMEIVLNMTFDMVLMDPFIQECFYGMIDHFKVPAIFLSSMPTPFWVTSPFGIPTLPSIFPDTFSSLPDKMNLWQRVKSTASHLLFYSMQHYFVDPKIEVFYKRRFPNSRSVEEIRKDVSLILQNNHVGQNYKRPLTPDVIDVGRLHCRDPKPLPKDLQAFADSSGPEGFIFFSLGSFAQESTIPDHVRIKFLNAFSKLNVKVLWKWSSDKMEGLPPNVKLQKWLPQQDVLGHPNCKLFITHGGLLSMQEAIYHGVPLLGFPMFGDQDGNLERAKQQGFALWLEVSTFTEDQFLDSIEKMLKDSTFRDSAKRHSVLYKDDLVNPLEKAVYWTEYILRHNGAPHLRSAGRDLNFVQFYSLDSIAIIFSIVSAVLYVLYLVIKLVLKKLASFLGFSSNNTKSKSE